jgi:hypothetical protein
VAAEAAGAVEAGDTDTVVAPAQLLVALEEVRGDVDGGLGALGLDHGQLAVDGGLGLDQRGRHRDGVGVQRGATGGEGFEGGIDGLALDHALEHLVLQLAAAPVEGGHLVLQALELAQVGDVAPVELAVDAGGLLGQDRQLVLQHLLGAIDVVAGGRHRRRLALEGGELVLQRGEGGALGQVVALVAEHVGGRVELLHREQIVEPSHPFDATTLLLPGQSPTSGPPLQNGKSG